MGGGGSSAKLGLAGGGVLSLMPQGTHARGWWVSLPLWPIVASGETLRPPGHLWVRPLPSAKGKSPGCSQPASLFAHRSVPCTRGSRLPEPLTAPQSACPALPPICLDRFPLETPFLCLTCPAGATQTSSEDLCWLPAHLAWGRGLLPLPRLRPSHFLFYGSGGPWRIPRLA